MDDMLELELAGASRRVVEGFGVDAGEEVLVIADPGTVRLGRALATAARAAEATAVLTVMPPLEANGAEPTAAVADAMSGADAVFAANEHSLAHTEARKTATAAGTRVSILRGVTEEMMIAGAMAADFDAVRELTAAVCAALDAAGEVHVTSAAGTDIRMDLDGRLTFPIDGDLNDPPGFANLPPGMAVTSPVEGTAEGTVVLDFSMDGIGRLDAPIELSVEGGRVTGIDGDDDADALRALLDGADANARNFAEFAVGTNPAARLIGNLAEDKKRAGTVDVALGDNASIGGTVESGLHLDAIVTRPTVRLDGRVVIEDGEIDADAVRAVS